METLINTARNLPESAGVYIFKDHFLRILYIGKAINLRRRVSQYFQNSETAEARTSLMISQVATLETIQTVSEFDALLLEAKLIHDFNQKYNVIAKDDKSPIYICLTMNEELPRVLQLRKTSIPENQGVGEWIVFGPFQSTRLARKLLRTLRSIVPYCTQRIRNGRPCFYTQLNLCRPCPSLITKMKPGQLRQKLVKEYRQNIFRLRDILVGKASGVLKIMEKQMNQFAYEQNYEEAAVMKKQVQYLLNLQSRKFTPMMYLEKASRVNDIYLDDVRALQLVLQPYYSNLAPFRRIECIDIASLNAKYATGSLVVFTDGIADLSQYRRFRINVSRESNDIAMICEVIRRRFNHPEWQKPQLMVVDGGKGQAHAARVVLANLGLDLPIIGLAKRFEEIVVPYQGSFKLLRIGLSDQSLQLLQRIRDEAHRYARNYHFLLRRKAFSV